jgi:hypothetical protein
MKKRYLLIEFNIK